MNKGQRGRLRDTCDIQKMLIFERVPGLRPRAHLAHRFLHTHTKIDNIPSINIHTYSIYNIIYSIIYIYNIIIINYIYSIYTIHSICDIPHIYNILCNIKNRWTRWARGRTTAKAFNINSFETFVNAPSASTCPHFPEFLIEDKALRPNISAFLVDCCAFLTIPSKRPEISAFSSLVSCLIREGKPKKADILAFFSWLQHLFDKNTNKDLIFQSSYNIESIHMSKSDSYIKISENNDDK
jgi:hypothetical protein